MNHNWHGERRVERHGVVLPARVRTCTGFLDKVTIVDLSEWGCRVESRGLALRKGDLVVVRPEGIEGICARVCWVHGDEAGIEFDRPLYGPVVEHLVREHWHFLARSAAPGPALRLAA